MRSQTAALVVAVVCLACGAVEPWRIFQRGRGVGGNIGLPTETRRRPETLPREQWFVQTLDHFDATDGRTWKQRYYTNDTFHDRANGGPVFLMIGGEGEATAEWMVEGAWIDYARRFGALCFQLEHRFYGKSRPTPDTSVENLRYLSSEQALADLASFVEAMNDEHGTGDAAWIVFGGSYPGSLAAWMRLKYPHLVAGAVSTSGPLLAEVDFAEYYRVVERSLREYGGGDECVASIRSGTAQVDALLRHRLGRSALAAKFRLCEPLGDEPGANDVSNLHETLAGNFAGVVQYNKDNRRSKHALVANITIETLCAIMRDESAGPPVDRLAAVNALVLDAYAQPCLDYVYATMIESSRNASWDAASAEGGRQWAYQTCAEFGFFQTSSRPTDLFGARFPADFYVAQCFDVFGVDAAFVERSVRRTNAEYGALAIDATNVVFVHGSVDPWHALGITKTVEQDAPAIYIHGTAHCANMYPEAKTDPPQLRAAREQIASLIGTWIRLGKSDEATTTKTTSK